MRVKLYGVLRDEAGTSALLLPVQPGETVNGVLQQVTQRYPRLRRRIFDQAGGLQPFLLISLNGRDIRHDGGTGRAVAPDDELLIFPPGAGG